MPRCHAPVFLLERETLLMFWNGIAGEKLENSSETKMSEKSNDAAYQID